MIVFTDLFASSPGLVATTLQELFLVSVEARLALALLAPSIWAQSLVETLFRKTAEMNWSN